MEYMRPSVCPQCGSTANVRTIQELLDMLGQMREAAMREREQLQQFRQPGGQPGYSRHWNTYDQSADQQIANAVLSAAGHLIGKAIGKRARRIYQERILPDLDAQWEQSRRDQIAIAERYPELRGCTSDLVIFLAGGTRTVPLAEVARQITLAHADAVVATLRMP